MISLVNYVFAFLLFMVQQLVEDLDIILFGIILFNYNEEVF